MSSFRKHNMWSYDGWVYCCFRPSVNTIHVPVCSRIMVGFVVRCHQSVNTICVRIIVGFVVVVRR